MNDLSNIICQWNQEKQSYRFISNYLQFRLKNKPFVLLLVAVAGLAVTRTDLGGELPKALSASVLFADENVKFMSLVT